ncbi:uncharacterized protein LOC135198508 [Macrobrachium nipponense]|uniref:uncharacterized protein LOC135198508 n=1 Tax=Macrobrachium nipponense TaxID=159736 RepID=UPI0030C83637
MSSIKGRPRSCELNLTIIEEEGQYNESRRKGTFEAVRLAAVQRRFSSPPSMGESSSASICDDKAMYGWCSVKTKGTDGQRPLIRRTGISDRWQRSLSVDDCKNRSHRRSERIWEKESGKEKMSQLLSFYRLREMDNSLAKEGTDAIGAPVERDERTKTSPRIMSVDEMEDMADLRASLIRSSTAEEGTRSANYASSRKGKGTTYDSTSLSSSSSAEGQSKDKGTKNRMSVPILSKVSATLKNVFSERETSMSADFYSLSYSDEPIAQRATWSTDERVSSPIPQTRRAVNGLRQCDSLENVCDSNHDDQIENGLGLAAQPAAANALSLPHIHQLSDYDEDNTNNDSPTENDPEQEVKPT